MGRFGKILAIAAIVLSALAMARLADAFGKRELLRVAHEVAEDRARVAGEHGELTVRRDHLDQDRQLLGHKIDFMSKREHYLVINRRRRRLQLLLGDKEMLDVRYRLRGSSEGVTEFRSLPRGTFQVLGKRMGTDWYRPDWLYWLEGVTPPVDSAARLVRDAFGKGELFLGGGISIHGRVDRRVPDVAIDHSYIELDSYALDAIVNAIEPGALVYIE